MFLLKKQCNQLKVGTGVTTKEMSVHSDPKGIREEWCKIYGKEGNEKFYENMPQNQRNNTYSVITTVATQAHGHCPTLTLSWSYGVNERRDLLDVTG